MGRPIITSRARERIEQVLKTLGRPGRAATTGSRSGTDGRGITIAAMTRPVLLALDTSTEDCSVALLDADAPAGNPPAVVPRVLARHEKTGAVSSARVLPAVKELFDEAGL